MYACGKEIISFLINYIALDKEVSGLFINSVDFT